MNIRIGKYVITSDSYNLVVSEIKTQKEGKEAGAEIRVNPSYHANLTGCINNIIDRGVRGSQAASLAQLKAEIGGLKEQVKKSLEGI